MVDLQSLVESGRGILSAPRRSGGKQFDVKFALGDLFVDVDADDAMLDLLAKELGNGITGHNLKSYRDVARAWPAESRVDASWTTHRTLANNAERLNLIKPGMTLRQAQIANGGRPADAKHPSRWSFDERVDFLITQLQDKETNAAVRDRVDQVRKLRAVKSAARVVQEDQSAEYKDALRALRDRNNAKSPDLALLDAIFKLRHYREYLRAIARASMDEYSFIPEHRKPEVVDATHDLAVGAVDTLAALGSGDPSVASAALHSVADRVQSLVRTEMPSGFQGVILDAEPLG